MTRQGREGIRGAVIDCREPAGGSILPTETLIARGVVALVLLAYAICFGKIASRLGRSPLLFGVLAVVPAVNLVALAWLAFRDPPDTA